MEDLEDDGWLGNEPEDKHPLFATAKKRVDLVTIAITAVLQAMDTFPADRLYQILNAIFDNKAELAAVWKGANALTPQRAVGLVTPDALKYLHPGAQKFFKEKGVLK
jgi:TRAP-type uncharacterized transport system substrate-binding protein